MMGLRDLFRRAQSAPARSTTDPSPAMPSSGERRFPRDRGHMFDIGKTATLGALFAVPREARDAAWVSQFWDAAWLGSVALAEPRTFQGPDGFPYLRLDLPRPETAFESQCLANLAPDCLKNWVGAAFFANPDDGPGQAQFVLTYGVIDSLLRYDSPFGDPVDLAEAEAPVDPATFEVERGTWSRTAIAKAAHEVLIG